MEISEQGLNSMVDTIAKLLEKNKILREERNAAVKDICTLGHMGAFICPVCAHYNHGEGYKGCISCLVDFKNDCFEWRGVQHE